MPDGATPAPALDIDRLERILAPFAAAPDRLSVAIVDPGGELLAGRAAPVHPDGPEADGPDADALIATDVSADVAADVVVDGVRIARVVATGTGAADALVAPAVTSIAIAVGELVAETRARVATGEALAAARSETLDTDAAELAKGRRQQRSILSIVPPNVPGYDLASHYAAAREIGGDFFEFFRLHKRGRPLGIVIADVTGKGLDAALLMAFSRPVMHSALNAATGPADALVRTNRVLVGERRGTLFITALCAVLEPRTGRIRIADAGHEPPLLIPADGGPIRPIGESGVLLGAFATISPPETVVTLEPGDTLFGYTDGATDAVDPSGARFGDERLLATIEAARGGSAHALVAEVRAAVEAFQAGAEAADDLTIVAVRRHPVVGGRRGSR